MDEVAAAAQRLFAYRAIELATGRVRQGEQMGEDAYAVRAALRRVGLQVEAVRPVGGGDGARWLGPLRAAWQARQRRRRRGARADLFDALATMLEAGLPLEQGVAALAASPVRGAGERHTLIALREHLRAGTQLSDACSLHPDWFDALDIAMIGAGQQAGNLVAVLRDLSRHHQAGTALGHRLFTALAYPCFLLLMAVVVVVFLSRNTLPQLLTMLESAQRDPPAVTLALVGLGDAVYNWWWLALLAVLFLLPLMRWCMARIPTQSRLGTLLSGNPFARALRRGRVAGLAFTLARLQRSGLPLTDSLQAAAEVADSRALRRLLLDAAEQIRDGRDFSRAIAGSDLLDPEFAQLLELGEQSGELPSMLERIADRYQRAASRSIERLTALLEPVAILVLALLIGTVVLAAIAPLLQMSRIV
ncbi:MAG: type II secretion system F family protein [Planctomycetota bacterium]